MNKDVTEGRYLRLDRPHWFKDKYFLQAITYECTRDVYIREGTVLPGYQTGINNINKTLISEASTTILYYEGIDTLPDLPLYIKEEIDLICKQEGISHGLIWISNIGESRLYSDEIIEEEYEYKSPNDKSLGTYRAEVRWIGRGKPMEYESYD
jgi:hypothetical protein